MSRTLIYTVQRVLEKLDLDSVNSINDSQDALLIARECEDTYYDLRSRSEWPETIDLLKVESVGDTNNPTSLRVPDSITKIDSVRYNVTASTDTTKTVKELTKLTPDEFLDMVYSRNSSDTNVVEAKYNDITLYVFNDKAPEYYTTFDNEFVILDSWYQDVETTVQGTNSVIMGVKLPVWQELDTFVIPVNDATYPLYLAEVTAAASHYLNGSSSAEDERRRNRGISRMRQEAGVFNQDIIKNKFGRLATGRA